MYILGAFHSRWVTIAAKLHLTGVIPHRVSLLAAHEPLQGGGMWRSSWGLLARTLLFLEWNWSSDFDQLCSRSQGNRCCRSADVLAPGLHIYIVSWSKLTSWKSYEIEPIWTNPQKRAQKCTKMHQVFCCLHDDSFRWVWMMCSYQLSREYSHAFIGFLPWLLQWWILLGPCRWQMPCGNLSATSTMPEACCKASHSSHGKVLPQAQRPHQHCRGE